MKTRLNVWLLGVVALLASAAVCAGPGGGGHGHRFAERGAMPMSAGPVVERPLGQQDFRRDDAPMFGRMSPEERRQLRRDIRNAGEDIYRRPPPFPPTDSR
jgi:hypothetical protein